MIDGFSVQLDYSQLQRGIEMGEAVTMRTMDKFLKDTAVQVLLKAIKKTPSVTIAQIDRELDLQITAKIGVRGKPLSQKYTKNKIYAGGLKNSFLPPASFASLIVLASMRRNSRYNLLTNWRWQRPNLTGFSDKQLATPMVKIMLADTPLVAGMVDRMIKARHSSTKFLIAGWVAAIRKLIRFGAPAVEGADWRGGRIRVKDNMGNVEQGRSGATAYLVLENLIGTMPGATGDNSKNYNQALWKYGAPALQEAMNEQGREMVAHYQERFQRELNRTVQPVWA